MPKPDDRNWSAYRLLVNGQTGKYYPQHVHTNKPDGHKIDDVIVIMVLMVASRCGEVALDRESELTERSRPYFPHISV